MLGHKWCVGFRTCPALSPEQAGRTGSPFFRVCGTGRAAHEAGTERPRLAELKPPSPRESRKSWVRLPGAPAGMRSRPLATCLGCVTPTTSRDGDAERPVLKPSSGLGHVGVGSNHREGRRGEHRAATDGASENRNPNP